MEKKRFSSRLMYMGGLLELTAAVLHFLMPYQFIREEGFACLQKPYLDFVILATLAIGLCLAVFGLLSLYFSGRLLSGEKAAWTFGISQGILWSCRAVLEITYPVRIRLAFLSNPTAIILCVSICLALMFLIPMLAFKREIFA